MFITAIIGIIFFLILILLAVRFGIAKQKVEKERESQTVIHTSGIYSIMRKSPREDIGTAKPSITKISQYLAEQNVDIDGKGLSQTDKDSIIDSWNTSLENSLTEVEEGDKKGLEFYYYYFADNDKVCEKYVTKGCFVTRQDLFKHPELIPPFHLGCRCLLKCHHGAEKIKDTTQIGMRPFLNTRGIPPLPDWKNILRIE